MHKRNYKKKVPSQILEPNDTVLLRNVSEKERAGKVRTYCEKDIYPLVLNRKEEKTDGSNINNDLFIQT